VSNPGGFGGDVTRGLERALADERADAAIAARTARWWKAHDAASQLTLGSALDAIAMRDAVTVITTDLGRVHRGAIRHVGASVTVIEVASGLVAIALDAVVTVRVEDGRVSGSGRRVVATSMTDVFELALGERWTVTCRPRAGDPVQGVVSAVGDGVVMLRTGPVGATSEVLVALQPLSEVVLATSG
jgi:hypothetical protein